MTADSGDDYSFVIICSLACVPFFVDLDLNFPTILALFLILPGAVGLFLESGYPKFNAPILPVTAARKRGALRLGG